MVTQQKLFDQAEVCSRALKRASNPNHRLALWHLRELWKALAIDGLHQKDLDEQVGALSEVQANLLAHTTRH